MDVEEHELSAHSNDDQIVSRLPQADGGRQAYLVLFGCSLLQLPVWGFSISYGVLQQYYQHSISLKGNLDSTGIIGTTLTGVIYLSMPILFGLFSNQFAHWRRRAFVVGALLSTATILTSAFASSVWQLIVLQGVLQGFGATLLYCSGTVYIDEWFVRRKGFAYGITLSVKSAVGVLVPLLFNALLSRVGLKNTMIIWSGLVSATSIPAFFMLRPRVGTPGRAGRTRRLSWTFLKHPTFWTFQFANVVFSASYGMPQTYLSSFASDVLNFSGTNSALMLTALNAPSILASLWFGKLSDGEGLFRGRSLSISTVSLLSAFGACLPVFIFWGLVPENSGAADALLALFAITYGFFAGGYSATWGGVVKKISDEADARDEAVDTSLLFGLLNGGRGIGYVVGGFAGVQLLKAGPVGVNSWAYGTSFGSLILFTGAGAAFGGISVLCKR